MHVNDHHVRAATFLAVIFMLAACSSGAPTASDTPEASSAGDTGTAQIPAAKLTFSGGQESARIGPYTQVFATPLPASAAQAKVIKDFRAGQILWGQSNEALRPVAPVLAYVVGTARHNLMSALAAGRKRHLVPAGTERFFKTRVVALSGSSATVTTCDDGSKYREQNPRTGTINPAYTPGPNQAYAFVSWDLVLRSGRWALAAFTFAVLPDSRARPCQP
jgi:hypothetical protein